MPRTLLTTFLGVIATIALWITPGSAQQTARLLYAAVPGILGNNINYAGVGILIFDIDNGHKFLRRVPLQGALPAPNASGIVPVEAILGIAAHAPTARLYLSTSHRMAAYDLLTDKLVWEQNYEKSGIDRGARLPRKSG